MAHDRITQLRVSGLRTLDALTLDLQGLTVLVGENGSGKSSILEALVLLRRVATGKLFEELFAIHGGPSLLRVGQTSLHIGATIEGGGEALLYDLELSWAGTFLSIQRESLVARSQDGSRESAVLRSERGSRQAVLSPSGALEDIRAGDSLLLTLWGDQPPHPAIERMKVALTSIEVHSAFDLKPAWASRSVGERPWLREPSQLQPVQRLDLFGRNLASAYHRLLNSGEEVREATLQRVRIGLGPNIETLTTSVADTGSILLRLKYRGIDQQVPASGLSDGMLAYLAFVALCQLGGGRSILAFDEPELHMHPSLLVTMLGMLETVASEHPVLLATHSDRLLDALADPAASVVLCEVDPSLRTHLSRPDRGLLERWLKRYRGLGALRAENLEPTFMREAAR